MHIEVILHNIRSAHNVGSIFRTADGAGVTKIYLTGYTPEPVDRFGRAHKEILKTSLGATHSVPHVYEKDTDKLIHTLRKEKKKIIAVEQTAHGSNYQEFRMTGNTVFIFGNEITGIEKEVLALADECIEIPMLGKKESLNVSVCAGIILFHFRN